MALAQTGRFPQFLPDGRHFLFHSPATLYSSGIHGVYGGDLGASESRHIMDADGPAFYSPTGHLLFVRQDTLFAQAFDASRLASSGEAIPVARQVVSRQLLFAAPLAVSSSGPIAFRTGPGGGMRQLVWVDRAGKEVGRVGEPTASMVSPAISPDRRRLAVHRAVSGNTDIWIVDLDRGVFSRATFNPAADASPVWSPDGTTLMFQSPRTGRGDLYRLRLASGAMEELVFHDTRDKWPTDWSTDGRFVLFNRNGGTTGHDLWALQVSKPDTPIPVLESAFDEEDAQFSPDGRWIAYQSNETGRFEIYVLSFPGRSRKIQISKNGGAQVRWRHDGRELFYVALDGRLMAVPIQRSSDGATFNVAAPVALFAAHVGGAVQTNSRQQYVVSDDGQRFLLNTVLEEALAPITILLNWNPNR